MMVGRKRARAARLWSSVGAATVMAGMLGSVAVGARAQSASAPASGQSTSGQSRSGQGTPIAGENSTRSSSKLAASAVASYDNRYEVYGGINFMNGQAGQNLPKRMNFGGAETMATYWVTRKLGVAGDYRWDGGSTPVLSPYYNRVLVIENIGMGGVQYRGPKGRYAAVDYHALAGVAHGTFDHAMNNYPGGSPVTAAQVGLYTNRTSLMMAFGGSVDFNYTKNIAIRLQPDLIMEHFGTELREFVAVSGGVVYRFGKK